MHSLNAVHEYFADYPGQYWIAGGWALDLFADRVRREHTDVDVLVLARDLDLVAATFTDPRPAVENPNTGAQRPWQPGETLTPGPDVLAFPDDLLPIPVRIILAAADGDDWVYHRGRGTIRKPLADITLTRDGIPYLAPEIALLFKSRSDRVKDTADFHDVAALLDAPRRAWLHNHIEPRYPDHAWLAHLK
ncbi:MULTISPECIES: nucleotidyltransferase domain-containing protein [Kribbella]|uniref:Amino acid transporter n=1 Tax=Kribbella karoonensis TaxID=324851 RepID=A0ABN2DVZ9_9ACTN